MTDFTPNLVRLMLLHGRLFIGLVVRLADRQRRCLLPRASLNVIKDAFYTFYWKIKNIAISAFNKWTEKESYLYINIDVISVLHFRFWIDFLLKQVCPFNLVSFFCGNLKPFSPTFSQTTQFPGLYLIKVNLEKNFKTLRRDHNFWAKLNVLFLQLLVFANCKNFQRKKKI